MTSPAPTLHIEGSRLTVPASAWRLDGFRAWIQSQEFPTDVRASFLAGDLFIERSPDSIESHNKVKTALTGKIDSIVQDEDLGEVYSNRALLSHPKARLSTEPDLMFASWQALESGRLRLLPGARSGDYVELEGTPDLVVEVLSDSSERKDLEHLRTAYARAEIPEYWIIDARGNELCFDVLRLSEGEYHPTPRSGAGSVLTPRETGLARGSRMGRSRSFAHSDDAVLH